LEGEGETDTVTETETETVAVIEELVVSEGDVALLKGRPGFVDGKFRGRGDCRNNLRIKV
jgi:hypothetical protein